MPNPMPAYPNTTCDECDEKIDEGDDVYFCDGNKLCQECAQAEGYVCDCGNYKSQDFNQCYECSRS